MQAAKGIPEEEKRPGRKAGKPEQARQKEAD
jgi:hypothetical protein